MKIYTKTGDAGESSLLGGQRVKKDALRLQAYGTVDELNSAIGLVRAQLRSMTFSDQADQSVDASLERIQNELFNLGGQLACEDGQMAAKLPKISADAIEAMEWEIDRMESQLAPLKNFVLPGGSLFSAHTHMARTIARRTERCIVSLYASESPISPENLKYINRLSDYLFVLARYLNHKSGFPDQIWKK